MRLEQVKQDVKSLINLVKVRRLREEAGLPVPLCPCTWYSWATRGQARPQWPACWPGSTTPSACCQGPAGGGGRLRPGGRLCGADRLKTQEVIQKAIGGVLFIDEAYALVNQDNGNDFGREVIEVLLKNMEDHRKDLVVIVAGYSQLMEKFIHSNPGLESRFNKYFYFEDYDGAQLFTILQSMCVKNGYVLTPEGEALARRELMASTRTGTRISARRDVRNLFEQAVARQSDRVARLEAPTREQLMALRPEDLAEPGDASSPQGAMEV